MTEYESGVAEPDDAGAFQRPMTKAEYDVRLAELRALIQEGLDSGPSKPARSADDIIRAGYERLKRIRGA